MLVSGLENCRTQKSPFLSMSRNQKRQGTYTETAVNVPFTGLCADVHSPEMLIFMQCVCFWMGYQSGSLKIG